MQTFAKLFAVEKKVDLYTILICFMEVITLKRIAEVLGLSISTVSRALKNHPDISANTKKRVNEIAEFLDYEPNINAINLRSQKNRVLGLIVPTISGFFYDSFISAVEEECRANNYILMILQSANDPEIEINNLSICKQNRISGLFVCLAANTTNMGPFDKFIEAEIPLVFFDKVPDSNKYNRVCIADEDAAKKAAELLIGKNKKRILGLFGNRSLSITKNRLEAFNDSFSTNTDTQIYIEHCDSQIEANNITKQYFSKKIIPDAIFCMSDETLIGAMKILKELKINIPAKTAVVALSDGFMPKLFTPEITYIETSGYKLGKLAYIIMMNCINEKKEPIEVFIDSPIHLGESI